MKNSTIRLLVIEDDPSALKTISTLIGGCAEPRFAIAYAGRLDEGLAMLKKDDFDAVLLDLDLPDSRGLDGIDRLAESRAGVPVIALAGAGDENTCMRALWSRAADCLIKDRLTSFSVIRAVRYAIGRKEAEEGLRESEQRLRLALEAAGLGVGEWDPVHDYMIWENPRVYEIFGRRQEDGPLGKGRIMSELVHPDDVAAAEGAIARVVESGGRLHAVFRIRRQNDGELRWVELYGRGLHKADGKPLRIVAVVGDVTERKRAEEAVSSAKQEWELTFDSVPDLIAVLDNQYRIMRVNRAMAGRMGLPPEQCIGRTCYVSMHGEDGPPSSCPHTMTMADGRQHTAELYDERLGRYFSVTTTPLLDERGRMRGSVHVARDVTERKRAEDVLQSSHDELEKRVRERTAELKKAEDELRKINETLEQRVAERTAELHESREDLKHAQAVARTGSWRLDVRRNELLWSEETHRMFGIPAGTSLTYETFLDAVHPDDRGYVDRKWEAALRGAPYDIEHRIVVGDAVRWVRERAELEFDKDGMLKGGFGTVQDVTERKLAEAKISGLAQFPSENPQPVFRAEADGSLLYANRPAVVFLKAMEWSKGELLPDPLPDKIRRVMQSGVPARVEMGDLDGRVWSILLAPIANERYVNLYGYDITEQKRAQEILERSREEMEKLVQERTNELLAARHEMERAKRLADVGALAATVAHELRNPLAAIKMAAYNITKKSKDPSLARHLGNIDAKVDESDQIINNLLFYSRLQKPRYEQIEIYWILKESADHACGMRKSVSFGRRYKALKGLRVEVDALQMRELFNNVINNACDAVSDVPKARIVLEGEVSEREGTFTVTVRDNGVGIEKEDLDRVFDPFFSTKAKGTGLGLTVSSHIVNLHGGKMSVKSAKGRGTTVTISIPLRRHKGRRSRQ